MMFTALAFVLLLGGGNNAGDLLDFTPTEAYWQMRDERVVDVQTMSAVLEDDEATATDRLMAIRALGELAGAEQELGARIQQLLKPLTESEEPFVAEYAKRSIAWIKGEVPQARPALAKEAYDLDLALFPPDTMLVGQMEISNGIGPVDLAALIPDVKVDGESMRDMMMQEMVPGIVQASQMIGNARADMVTAGMYLESEDDFWFMVVVRGQYDRVGVQVALEEEIGDDEDASFYSVGDVEVVQVGGWSPVAMLMPSDELFVLLASESREARLPIEAVAKALSQADRKPAFDEELAKQVEAIDRDEADVWAAMRVSQFMKDEPEVNEVFGAFDAARAFAVRDAEGELEIQWVAEGSDAEAVGQAAAFFTEQVQEGIGELRREKEHMPAEMQVFMDPVLEMMESMKFEHDGKSMKGGMKVDPGLGMSMPMMMFGMNVKREADFAAEAGVAEKAVEIVPAEAVAEEAVEAVEEEAAEAVAE